MADQLPSCTTGPDVLSECSMVRGGFSWETPRSRTIWPIEMPLPGPNSSANTSVVLTLKSPLPMKTW